jgi:glycosyltransferase involved in cell wall biosynthesis
VIHTHQIGALLYAGPAARRAGVPRVVHTEHIDNAGKLTSRWRRLKIRLLWKMAGRYASRFFCVSCDIAESVTAYGVVPGRKVEVVPNGIDTHAPHQPDPALRRSLGLPTDAPVIGTVGRLNEVKRQDLLLRAFAAVQGGNPGARLLLVGDGPEREALGRLAGELGVAESVHFVGYQPRPEQFLRLMDVFALPSRLEGMPLAILEAWAARLPVVATAVGGVPKLVEDGRTGLLVPSGDADALAETLTALLNDPARSARLADAGRDEVCRGYGLDRMADAYARAYEPARSGKGAARRGRGGLQPDTTGARG